MTATYAHSHLPGIVKQKKKELKRILDHFPKEYYQDSVMVAIETLNLSLSQDYEGYQSYYDQLSPQLKMVAKRVHENIGTQFNSRERIFAAQELILGFLYELIGDKSLEMKLINGKH